LSLLCAVGGDGRSHAQRSLTTERFWSRGY